DRVDARGARGDERSRPPPVRRGALEGRGGAGRGVRGRGVARAGVLPDRRPASTPTPPEPARLPWRRERGRAVEGGQLRARARRQPKRLARGALVEIRSGARVRNG